MTICPSAAVPNAAVCLVQPGARHAGAYPPRLASLVDTVHGEDVLGKVDADEYDANGHPLLQVVERNEHFPSWHFDAELRSNVGSSGRGSPFHSLSVHKHMLLTIVIALLTLALTMLQILRPSRSGWDAAKVICIALVALTFWNAYEQDKDREFTIGSLKTIASYVDWDETEASIEFVNYPSDVSPADVSAYVKMMLPGRLAAPDKLDLLQLQKACVRDNRWGYDYLPEAEAEQLFRLFERVDGSTVLDDETAVGVEHLFYAGQSVTQSPSGNSRVKLHLDLGPGATSKFASLADLEGSLIVALVQAPPAKHLIFSSFTMRLHTAAGRQTFYAPIRLEISKSPEGFRVPRSRARRYLGFCVPKEFFTGVRRGA